MCSRYTYNKDEAKLKLRDQILVFGFVPRGDIRPNACSANRSGNSQTASHTQTRLIWFFFFFARRFAFACRRLRQFVGAESFPGNDGFKRLLQFWKHGDGRFKHPKQFQQFTAHFSRPVLRADFVERR